MEMIAAEEIHHQEALFAPLYIQVRNPHPTYKSKIAELQVEAAIPAACDFEKS
jgi:hypothetical protein